MGDQLEILNLGRPPKHVSRSDFPNIGAKCRYGLARENRFTLEVIDAGPTVFEIHGTFHVGEEFDQVIKEFLRVIKLPTTNVGDNFLIKIAEDD